MQARTASIAHQVDAATQRLRETEQRLKPRGKATQPPSGLTGRLPLHPGTVLAVPVSLNADLHGMLILQGSIQRMEAGADALQRDKAGLDANPMAAKAAWRAADMRDHDIAAAHAACAAAKAKADTPAGLAASTAAGRRKPRIALAAPGVEQRAAVKPRGKPRSATKRKPVEQAAAGHRAALASPPVLRAMTTAGSPGIRLRPPVHGVIVREWGEATDAGPATGVSYQALSGARVIAPCGGRVVFANSFRSYGQLLILDCGGGYHMVLSGLEKLDVRSGQTIDAGEPVGVMPFSEARSLVRRQVLYIELRHNGHPVDPARWLRKSS